jgi:hypothetical protein
VTSGSPPSSARSSPPRRHRSSRGAVGDVALNALTLDWKLGLGVAAGGALASLLTSLASVKIGPTSSPWLVGEADRH